MIAVTLIAVGVFVAIGWIVTVAIAFTRKPKTRTIPPPSSIHSLNPPEYDFTELIDKQKEAHIAANRTL